MHLLQYLCSFAGLLSLIWAQQQPLVSSEGPAAPKIIFILTDDQDLQMNSLNYMPFLQKHLMNEGTFYRRHYCTVALCCPSRVSLWTGKTAHNTNVTDVNPPYGGYPKFVAQGLNEAYLPIWLQDIGYRTYYVGKLFNSHTVDNHHDPYPAGFTQSDFLLDPYTYEYLNATFQRNREPPKSYEGHYSTDVVAAKSYDFLEDAIASKDPFFLAIAPVACHSNMRSHESHDDGGVNISMVEIGPPIPAERHKDLFPDDIVPRNSNFNPKESSGVNWIRNLPHQSAANVDSNDHFYRNRLRALQAVDEMIGEIVDRLEKSGILENTFIVYSSDNGYHIGQHRLQPGKECGFEEDINIPLIIRGPDVSKGKVTDIVTSHTDLAPTFLSLAGGKLRSDFDGVAIPVLGTDIDTAVRHEHVNVEYWGFALSEGIFNQQLVWNNTYKSVRIIGSDYNLYYSVWCNNEHELYDMNVGEANPVSAKEMLIVEQTDPHQMRNIYTSKAELQFGAQSYAPDRVLERLDALLLVLKSCKGTICTQPWSALHPRGDVRDLHDALHPFFDHFYRQQPHVEFTRCEQGYIIDAEGPQEALAHDLVTRGSNRVSWSEFV